MTVALLTDPQYCAPAAANPVTLTPSGVAWTSSAWVDVLAAAPAAAVLTGLVVRTNYGGSPDTSFEVDVGTGSAGSETVIATFRGHLRGFFGSKFSEPQCWLPCGLLIDNIANGARVATRIRHNTTDTTAWQVAITYLQKPLTTTLLTTANPLKCFPVNAQNLSVACGSTAWTNGSWVQVRSASGPALVLVGLCVKASNYWEIDVGIGTAGSESVMTTLRGNASGLFSFPNYVPLCLPLDTIAASARVAVRGRGSDTSATHLVGLSYFEKPL
jgi:hypothetical protein